MNDTPLFFSLVAAAFILAGFVKGIIGLGLPTIAIGLLGLIVAPVEAAAMLVLPSLITNIWQLIAGPSFRALLKRFKTLLIGICCGTPIGVSFIVSGNTPIVTAGLGFVLMAYGLYGLSAARFEIPPRAEWWLSPLMGFFTGILMGATGISALPVAPYFTALGLKRDDLIQALGLSFTVSSIALAIGLLVTGEFMMEIATISLLALIPAFIGMFIGQFLRQKIPQEQFRRYFFASLLVLGGYTAYRAINLL
jgi:uncharacterized protein